MQSKAIVHQSRCYNTAISTRSRKQSTLATAVASRAAGKQQQGHKHVEELSLVLLVNKNLQKHTGRCLVEHSQLLTAHQVVNQADYALLLVGTNNSSHSSSSTADNSITRQQASLQWPVLYANGAAVDALASSSTNSTNQYNSRSSSSSSSDSQTSQPPQHVLLPEAVANIIVQQQNQQQQQQQQCGCSVLQDVVWQQNCSSSSLDPQQHACNSREGALGIKQLLCCHIYAPNDAYIGLALLFDAWHHSDGCLGVPGWARVQPDALPTQQQLSDAADAVRAQAEAVRHLKQAQGLSNKDPAVVQAVAQLQQLKQQLATLEGLQHAFQTEKQGTLQQLLQLLETRTQEQQSGQQLST